MCVICMIPARLGSKRIKKKALRMLGEKPLIQYVIDTAKEVFPLNKIYLNSSYDIFKNIAEINGIQFYKRNIELSQDDITSNEFIYDFINNVKSDYVVQLLLTSPFLTKKDISNFVKNLVKNNYDVFYSVKEEQIECVYKNQFVNFSLNEGKKKSQDLEPLLILTSGLAGFKVSTYLRNYEKNKNAMFGHNGDKIGYYKLSYFSAIDIDTEEDFRLAEAVLNAKRDKYETRYYDQKK